MPMVEPVGARLDRPDDGVGRADLVGQLDHLVGALGVDRTMPVGVLGPERRDVLGPEALVHRAVALPQQQGRRLHLGVLEAAQVEAGVPHRHVGGAVAELVAGVAAEVLVGEEEDLVADRPCRSARGRGPR